MARAARPPTGRLAAKPRWRPRSRPAPPDLRGRGASAQETRQAAGVFPYIPVPHQRGALAGPASRESCEHLGGPAEAVGRVELQAALKEASQLGVDRGVQLAARGQEGARELVAVVGPAVGGGRDTLAILLTGARAAPGHQEVERGPQPVEIPAHGGQPAALGLLGWHEEERADPTSPGGRLAQVAHAGVPMAVEEHVVELQVAVNEPALVGLVQSLRDLPQPAAQSWGRKSLASLRKAASEPCISGVTMCLGWRRARARGRDGSPPRAEGGRPRAAPSRPRLALCCFALPGRRCRRCRCRAGPRADSRLRCPPAGFLGSGLQPFRPERVGPGRDSDCCAES